MKKTTFLIFFVFIGLISSHIAEAQISTENDLVGRDHPNTITTAVPFLLIAPDTRAGGMGDAGVATTPDANSMHWNPAKYVFAENELGVAISYTPWLRQLVRDMNLAYLAGYKKLDDVNAISASLLYFDLGSISFRTIDNQPIRDFNPHEFALSFGYSRLLSEKFSGGVSMRYIYSNLTGGIASPGSGEVTFPGMSVAADVAFYYYNPELEFRGYPATFMWGVNVSNIGSKISYTTGKYSDFIPTNFRMGVGYKFDVDDYNSFLFTVDFNKLLVPTPPDYWKSEEIKPNGDTVKVSDQDIRFGKDPNITVPAALFSSWWDAPGVTKEMGGSLNNPNRFREELAEINISIGMEYWYDKQFALRAGYFHEHTYKGNRKYVTFGAGLKMNVFGLDFSFLVPTTQRNPLQNTMRFTLIFDIAGLAGE
jgi:hypothetical protein